MKEEDRILDVIHTTQEIVCTNCGDVGTEHNIDEYDAAKLFQSKGWRATLNNIYCTKCANIKLKPKK